MSTAIEWTEETWNPTTGCSKVSPGCDHCYAETLSLRHGWSKLPWAHENAAANFVLHPERLDKPRRWKKPRVVFVNSMSDLFHDLMPDDFLTAIWDVMVEEKRHTFQVLTKRPKRAAEFLANYWHGGDPSVCVSPTRPARNIWLGTSIESWRFNWRADQLRRAPAAVRFISAEPLLETLDPFGRVSFDRSLNLRGVDWLIVGGESGHGFRPMNVEWARELRDACADHGVAFFFKQWGGRTPKAGGRLLDGREWNEMPDNPPELGAQDAA